MFTTKINIKQHLSEYLYAKYDFPVKFPYKTDIYHLIFDLTEKRPVRCPIDSGNLEIVLPERRFGKQPKTYNYLGARSQKIIMRKIEEMFWTDFRNFVEFETKKSRETYLNIVNKFIEKYCIKSISEDALLKHYYRYRKKNNYFVKNKQKIKNI